MNRAAADGDADGSGDDDDGDVDDDVSVGRHTREVIPCRSTVTTSLCELFLGAGPQRSCWSTLWLQLPSTLAIVSAFQRV